MEMFVRRSPMFVKRFLKKAVPATAVVRYVIPDTGDGGGAPWDNLNAELEVSIGGREPYSLKGIFNGDKKLAPFVAPGATLPVRADPDNPNKVAIDWDEWRSAGGATDGDHEDVARANREAYEATGAEAVTTMAAGEEASFDSSSWQGPFLAGLEEARKLGNISEEEYQQARRDAGL
jgi:hypothetical protein